jgi:RNA polymerase sigma-70 factor (ECF subfamily)
LGDNESVRPVDTSGSPDRFEQAILPHLDAAYNLARWLTGNDHDAQDVTQEALLRAMKFFGKFRGTNPRAWLLTIVRNTGYTWLKQNRNLKLIDEFDEELHAIDDSSSNPDILLARSGNVEALRQAIEKLPIEFREIIILREMEELSYKEIADLAGVPIGTVMSRLARGRKQLQQSLASLTVTP